MSEGTRHVQLVRREGRDTSNWYGGRDETCPIGTGGGARTAARCPASVRRQRIVQRSQTRTAPSAPPENLRSLPARVGTEYLK